MAEKTVITIRISHALKAELQAKADEKGGNLSAEVLYRLSEYEQMRKMFDILVARP